MCELRRTARYMVPGLELGGLNEIAEDLAVAAQARIGGGCQTLLSWEPQRIIFAHGRGTTQTALLSCATHLSGF